MKWKNIKIISICILILIFIEFGSMFMFAFGRVETIPGFSTQDYLNSNESVDYFFDNGLELSISTNNTIDLMIDYSNQIENRQTKFIINSIEPISLNISSKPLMNNFGFGQPPQVPSKSNSQYKDQYHCIYRFQFNQSIENITIQFTKNNEKGLLLDRKYSIAMYENCQDSWNILTTNEIYNASSEETYIQSNILNLEGEKDYFFTIYEIENIVGEVPWFFIITIFSIVIGVFTLIVVISKTDYFSYLKTRNVFISPGAHRLSMEDVLDNENRNDIIELILNEPGIHFNELLRKTGLAAGNLVWHLEILDKYKIITKKDIGKYVAYFPYYQKNPLSNIDLKLQKSKLTLQILEMIEEEPGIWNNKITKKLNIDHKTTSYHLSKLEDLKLVMFRKEGRKKRFFLNMESEYYNGTGNK